MAWAGLVVFAVTTLVWVLDLVVGFGRSSIILSMIFFAVAGYLSGVGAVFLFARSPDWPDPDLLKMTSTLAVVGTLFMAWAGGPAEGFRLMSASYGIPGTDYLTLGVTYLVLFVGAFYMGGSMWHGFDRTAGPHRDE